MQIRLIVFLLFVSLCGANTQLGQLQLRPSFSYLTFTSSLATSSSNVVIDGTKMYILAKDFPESEKYVFLERELNPAENSEGLTYQKRNYNPKTPLLLNGLTPHGYTIVEGELRHLVATDPSNGDLYVATLGVKSITSDPSNVDYQYFVEEQKKVPKDSKLRSDIIVKITDASRTSSSLTYGKRIYICGTTEKNSLFFAIYNTVFNLTEYVYEDLKDNSVSSESCKDIHINADTGHLLIVTERTLTSSPNLAGIYVRGFSLERMVIDWEVDDSSIGKYVGSSLLADFLIVAHYETSLTTTGFKTYWIETGEPNAGGLTLPDNAEIVSMAADKSEAIYALIKKQDTKSVLEDGTYASLYGLILLKVEYTPIKVYTVATRWLDSIVDKETKESFSLHPAVKLFLHYPPPDSEVTPFPAVVLTGHLSETKSTGLIIYEFAQSQIKYGYNPFAVASTTSQACKYFVESTLADSPTRCLSCPAGKYLTNFACSDSCSGGYSVEPLKCERCHYSCSACTGPKRSQCTSCRSALNKFSTLLGQCFCTGESAFKNGECGSIDNTATIFQLGAERTKAPNYAFELKQKFPESFVSYSADNNNANAYEFEMVKLPLSDTFTTIPDDFTIGVWYRNVGSRSTGEHKVFTVFDSITVVFVTPPGTNDPYTLKLTIQGSTTKVEQTIETTKEDWKYVAVSVQNTALGYTLTFYVYSMSGSSNNEGTSITKKGYPPLDYVKSEKEAYLGGSGVVEAFRDFLIVSRYYSKEDLDIARTLKYHNGLQVAKDIIAYWRLNNKDSRGNGYFFLNELDSSLESVATSVASTEHQGGFKTAARCESKWGIVGTVFDLFGYSKFPTFSFDTLNFGANELEPKINLNTFAVLSAVIQEKDYISYHLNGCSGTFLGSAQVTFSAKDKVKIEENVRFVYDKSIRGRYVDSCYCNKNKECIHLGRTYFPLLPIQIYPAHGKTNVESTTPIQFELSGGDQSYGDKLTLINMGKDVLTTARETIIVDEKDSGYPSYSAIRRTTGDYDKITTTSLDRGVYTIGWRPSYMSYLVDERNVIYKNLYNTWTLQGPPQVKFPPLEGVPDVFKNTVIHKGEFYYIDLVGDGQADGDQIIFCNTGCNYPYKNSRPFQRENGRYPPIWIGEEDEIYGINGIAASARLAEKLFVCWRPAARAMKINPQDDQWTSLYGQQDPTKRAYIIINGVTDSKTEISRVSLYGGDSDSADPNYPVKTPVLYQGDPIWFRFALSSGCPEFQSNGKLEIARVVYDDYYKNSYTLETEWLYECDTSLGNTVCAEGKLKRDETKCQFTLQEIPHSTMKPGHDYMLIIHGQTFSYGGVYFGNGDAGTAEFKFLFKYQESTFVESTTQKLVPKDTSITIKGTNLGNLYIPGNTFVESRKLFGVAIDVFTSPECGNNEIRASYIPEHLEQDPGELVLSGLDLTKCATPYEISVSLKLIKIADDFGDYPLWSSTSTIKNINVGKVACDQTCKTCSGPTSFDCLTCDIDSSFPYLYKSRCVSKCENDMPLSNIVYDDSGYNIAYYECTEACNEGTYLNEKLNLCFECNSQCGTCSSGSPGSCTSCGSTYINVANTGNILNYMNVYKEMYSFKGMCFLDCPEILRVEDDPSSNVITIKEYNHTCIDTLEDSKGIMIEIQDIIFPEKVNIKRSIKLRALLTDLRTFDKDTIPLTAKYIWSSHPTENKNDEGFESSDKRVFQNYTKENLQKAITSLNMNAFNYKSDSDQMRIIVRAWANGYFDYDMIELYGNRPPELDDSNVKIKYTSATTGLLTSKDELKTGDTIDVHISKIQDADDLYPTLNLKVLLVPRSLVLPDPLPETTVPESALSLLAQLAEQYMVIYSSQVHVPEDGNIYLQNIRIPPLINGAQAISKSEKVYSSKISCDVFVYATDRYLGVSKSKFIYNIQESYDPENGDEILENIKNDIKAKDGNRELTWDDALYVAHTLRAVNPEYTLYYMSYSYCSRDDQCNNGGKCITSGGWSKCVCTGDYTGVTCSWRKKQMVIAEELVGIVVKFLNNTLLIPANNNPEFELDSTDTIDQLANVLLGILSNPEPISSEYAQCIVDLAEYMTDIDYITGGRLEDFERSNVFRALDSVTKYVYYYMRQSIHEFYLLGEIREGRTDQQIAEFNEMRSTFSGRVLKVRNSLYNFAKAVSLVQYPLTSPYSMEYDTFEMFLSAEMEESLFTRLGDTLAIQLRSGTDYIRIPSSILDTMRKQVSINEEFKIRIIKWKENPYIFSDYHSEVCTPIFNFALMNSDSEMIDMSLEEPIVLLAPIAKIAKNLPADAVRCMYFNDKNTINSNFKSVTKINVNQLDWSDDEKMAMYPEWNPEYYHSKNLIVEEVNYPTKEILFPEFENAEGLSSYGNLLNPTDYLDQVACALYTPNEVAGVAERKRSHTRGFPPVDFLYDYDPMDSLYFNIGLYTCIVVGALLIVSFIASLALDSALLPKHDRFIKSHRPASEKEASTDIHATGNPMFSIDSAGRDGSGSGSGSEKREETFKIGVDASGSIPTDHKIPKKQHKRRLGRKRTGRGGRSTAQDASKATKEAITEEKLMSSQMTGTGIEISQTKVELKGETDTFTTTHGHTSTQDPQATYDASTSDPQATNAEEHNLKKAFVGSKSGKGIKKKDYLICPVNIFSKEHMERIEIETFKFCNIFISSNPLLNLFFRSSNIYSRPARCFVMYTYVYIMLFWCAVLTSIVANSLASPENGRPLSFLASRHIWIIFVAPILSSILQFLVAGVFKVDEGRIRDGRTMERSEYKGKIWMRRIFGTILILICLVGINLYIYRFSIKYGWKTSYQWLWLSILCFPVDIFVYEMALAMIQASLYTYAKGWAKKIYNLRRLKQAEFQE